MNSAVVDSRYKFMKDILSWGDVLVALESISLDKSRSVRTEVFLAKAISGKIEMEVLHKKAGDLVSLPASVSGQTVVNYAGSAPVATQTPDRFGNLQVRLAPGSVVEVIFNREKIGARGRNKKPYKKKLVYIT